MIQLAHGEGYGADDIARQVTCAMQSEASIVAADDAKEVIDSAAASIRLRMEVV